MLIGLRDKFIFLATQKTASTAIETAWRPRADICISDAMFGKHLTIAEMLARYAWLFELRDAREFFIFGVIRDPVEFALSLFNSHKGPGFANMPHVYTGGMDFTDFIERWVPANYPQITPQHERFLDLRNTIGANYIITFDKLAAGLDHVSKHLWRERAPALKLLNKTPGGITQRDLRPEELAWIHNHFRNDYKFIRSYCNVPLRSFAVRPDFLP